MLLFLVHGNSERTNHMKVNPYLNYGGNCEEAFRFYEQHLGGKVTFMMTHEQAPTPSNIPDSWKKKILYAHMIIGENEIMGSDVPADRFQPMRSVYLSLAVGSNEEAERIHALFSQGGEIFMPLQETFFAFRFSMLRDKFGTSWMIIHQRPAPPKP
jgi:PhnB protein